MAKMAFQHVRASYKKGIKSSTKSYRSGPRENSDVSRVELAHEYLLKARRDYYFGNITQSDFFSGSEHAKIGNCGEMAYVTARYIIQHGGNARVCATIDNKTHSFCIAEKLMCNESGIISVKEFNNDSWVVDPWSGICCPANSYFSEFFSKMDKWTVQGKSVYFQGGWVKANNPAWIECVLYGLLNVSCVDFS